MTDSTERDEREIRGILARLAHSAGTGDLDEFRRETSGWTLAVRRIVSI